jgi:hypothetical protein
VTEYKDKDMGPMVFLVTLFIVVAVIAIATNGVKYKPSKEENNLHLTR